MRKGRDGVSVSAMIHANSMLETHTYLHRFHSRQVPQPSNHHVVNCGRVVGKVELKCLGARLDEKTEAVRPWTRTQQVMHFTHA